MRKYKAIYDVIYASHETKVKDVSNWWKRVKNYVEQNRPLWIILENTKVNLRIWVTHDFGAMQITTAQLDLECKSLAYSASHKWYPCKNQTEMADLLKKLLCVEQPAVQ